MNGCLKPNRELKTGKAKNKILKFLHRIWPGPILWAGTDFPGPEEKANIVNGKTSITTTTMTKVTTTTAAGAAAAESSSTTTPSASTSTSAVKTSTTTNLHQHLGSPK